MHEEQVEFLLDEILSDFNEKFDLHFDLYEEDFISFDKIQECLEIQKMKNPNFKSVSEKEAWGYLEEALKYADSKKMPVYFFF